MKFRQTKAENELALPLYARFCNHASLYKAYFSKILTIVIHYIFLTDSLVGDQREPSVKKKLSALLWLPRLGRQWTSKASVVKN